MLTFSHSYLSVHHAVFENILVPFRRDIIKRKENFFYPGTDSFKTQNMDEPSADYTDTDVSASSSGASFFPRLRRATGNEPPQGTMGKVQTVGGKPVVSFPPSFARTCSSRERRLGTRQQIYAAYASGMTRFGLFVIGSLSRHQKCTH